jgi:hypothetical protein
MGKPAIDRFGAELHVARRWSRKRRIWSTVVTGTLTVSKADGEPRNRPWSERLAEKFIRPIKSQL